MNDKTNDNMIDTMNDNIIDKTNDNMIDNVNDKTNDNKNDNMIDKTNETLPSNWDLPTYDDRNALEMLKEATSSDANPSKRTSSSDAKPSKKTSSGTKPSKKAQVAKVILYITLSIYPLMLLYALFSAINGYNFLFSTSYGWDGFISCLLITGFVLCIIPVLPACIIYQICYFVVKRSAFPKKAAKVLGIVFGSIFGVLILVVLCNIFEPDMRHAVQKHKAQRMINRAEASIPYDTACENCGGILGIDGYSLSHIFVDYDTHRIGFLCSSPYDEYTEYGLHEITDVEAFRENFENEHIPQAVIPLPDGTGTLYTFCANSFYGYDTTTAILVEFTNGTAYGTGELDANGNSTFSQYTSLTASQYSVYHKASDY